MSKYLDVLKEGKIILRRMEFRGPHVFRQATTARFYKYALLDGESGRTLLTISCQVPHSGDHPNHYLIGTVVSAKRREIAYFARAINMIRRDLRKTNARADIVSVTPTTDIRKFYVKVLGATAVQSGDRTVLAFPDNIVLSRTTQRGRPRE